MKNRPESVAAKVVYDRLQEKFKDLGGLNDVALKRLIFVIKEHLFKDQPLIKDFRFDVHTKDEPKRIVVHVFGPDGREMWVKLKDGNVFEQFGEWMGTEQYKIEFAYKE